MQDVLDGFNLLKNDKSPGAGGLRSEFYKAFASELAPFLLKVFSESIAAESSLLLGHKAHS